MPRIPRYQSQAQQTVRPAPSLQTGMPANPRAAHGSPQASARGNTGQLIENLGKGIMGVANKLTYEENQRLAREKQRLEKAEKEQEKYDNAWARNAEMNTWEVTLEKMRAFKENYKYGSAKEDGNGNSVYKNMQEYLREIYQETTKDATKQQKEFYQPGYDRIRKMALSEMDSYTAQQTEAWYRDKQEAQIKQREDQMIGLSDDPDMFAELQVENEEDLASLLKGQGKAVIDEAIQNSRDRGHSGVILKKLSDKTAESTTAAWEWYKKNSAEMSNKMSLAMKEKLESASLDRNAELNAKRIGLIAIEKGLSPQDQQVEADKIKNDDIRKKTKSLLKSINTEKRQQKELAAKEKLEMGVKSLQKITGSTREEIRAKSIEFINDNEFEGTPRNVLMAKIESVYKAGAIVTDPQDEEDLIALSINDKNAFVNLDLNTKQLSEADHKKYFKLQQEIKAGKDPANESGALISAGGKVIGLGVDAKDPIKTTRFLTYSGNVKTQIEELEREKKRPATRDEVNEIIHKEQVDYLMKDTTSGESFVPGKFWQPDSTYEGAVKAGNGKYWVPDLSKEQENYFKTLVDKEGLYEPDDFILRLYARDEMGIPLSNELKLKAQKYKK